MISERRANCLEDEWRDSPNEQIEEDVSLEVGKERSCDDIEDGVVCVG